MQTALKLNQRVICIPYCGTMVIILTTALVGMAALLLGKLNDPVSRELDSLRAETDLRNAMTPLFGGPSQS